MRYVSHADAFFTAIGRRFGVALEDAADLAGRLPGSPSDLRAERTGPLSGRVGSSKPYAKAQERGAYIVPRQAQALRFASGQFSRRARLRPKRYLAQTAMRWGDLLTRRLRSG